jgi:hypothetical protein
LGISDKEKFKLTQKYLNFSLLLNLRKQVGKYKKKERQKKKRGKIYV